LFYQSKPFVWSRDRFVLWRNLQGKAARAFISQSQLILLTMRLRVPACHIGRVRGLSFRAYPVSVSVDTEAPGELSSSYTLQERLHRFAAFVVSEKKLHWRLTWFCSPCGSSRSAFLVSFNRTSFLMTTSTMKHWVHFSFDVIDNHWKGNFPVKFSLAFIFPVACEQQTYFRSSLVSL